MTPPNNIPAEREILAGCLLDPDSLEIAIDMLKPEYFYDPRHNLIFTACQYLNSKNKPADLVSVADILQSRGKLNAAGGAAYMAEISHDIPMAVSMENFCQIIADKAKLRRLIKASDEIKAAAFSANGNCIEVFDDAQSKIMGAISDDLEAGYSDLSASSLETLDHLGELASGKGRPGIMTGIRSLDFLTGGFQSPDLAIIAGRPGMGKTALMLSAARNIEHEGDPVGIFSMEMNKQQLVLRLICLETGINSTKLKTGNNLTSDDFQKINDAIQRIMEKKIFICDKGGLKIDEIKRNARLMRKRNGIGILFIDYIQLITGAKNKSEYDTITEASKECKALAKELDIPVVVLSQLNRKLEERPNKRPVISDLRQTGQLEQDADYIIFPYRDEVYNPETKFTGMAELILAKHRNGPTSTAPTGFDGRIMSFYFTDEIGERFMAASGGRGKA